MIIKINEKDYLSVSCDNILYVVDNSDIYDLDVTKKSYIICNEKTTYNCHYTGQELIGKIRDMNGCGNFVSGNEQNTMFINLNKVVKIFEGEYDKFFNFTKIGVKFVGIDSNYYFSDKVLNLNFILN